MLLLPTCVPIDVGRLDFALGLNSSLWLSPDHLPVFEKVTQHNNPPGGYGGGVRRSSSLKS